MKKGLRDGGGCSKGSSGRMGIRENWSLYRLYMAGGWVDVKFNGEIRTKEAFICGACLSCFCLIYSQYRSQDNDS